MPVQVLVIGVGSIGERHVRCFGATGRADVSICEIGDEVRQRIADRYGVTRTYSNLDSALGGVFDSPIDAIGDKAAVVATPAHLHVPIATRVAEAGHHLLIEKPLATSLEGVEQLRQLVIEKGIVAAVGYNHRAQPALAEMKRAIDSGRFGAPVQIVIVAGQHFPTYRPAYREIYYADRATGGGAIQDGLTHLVNAGEWLVGPVDRVVADAAHQVLDGVEVEDTVCVLTRQGSVLGSYNYNQHQAPNETTTTVVCSQGTARFESHRHRWRWITVPDEDWNDEPCDALERDTLFIRQANVFLDAVEMGTKPLCSLDEGIQTLRVNLAILESATNGSSLREL